VLTNQPAAAQNGGSVRVARDEGSLRSVVRNVPSLDADRRIFAAELSAGFSVRNVQISPFGALTARLSCLAAGLYVVERALVLDTPAECGPLVDHAEVAYSTSP